MKKIAALIVLVLSAGPLTALCADAPKPRPLTTDDLYLIQDVSDPQVSPDGQWVAYVVSTNDRDADETRSAIWMVSWDGRQQIQLTNPAHDISAPRWSGDGRYLSFLTTPAGTEKQQIMVLDRRGGDAKVLTSVNDDIQSYEWSADGRSLVISMDLADAPPAQAGKPAAPKPIVINTRHFKQDKDGYLGSGHDRHLFLFDVESRRLEKLTSDAASNDDLPAWSPDGRHIAFVRTREKAPDLDGMTDIEVIEARVGAVATRLARVYVPNQQRLAWSPDGKLLAHLQGLEPKSSQYTQDVLAVVAASGSAPRQLSARLDRAVGSFAFAADSRSIVVSTEDDGTASPGQIDVQSGSYRKLADGTFVVSAVSAAADHIALLKADDSNPNEIYALESGQLRRLTHHNDALLAQWQLGQVEDFRFKSKDGTALHGLMVRPPAAGPGKLPAVLWIHGGPNLQDEHSLDFGGYQFKRQQLAARGFVVLGINYRGSSGRGTAFSRAILADWGHKELEDLTAGIDYLVAKGVIDPARLGIGGWSYGGILTDYMIASSPRFKAAVSGAGTANPIAMYGTDEYEVQYNSELGVPWRNSALYLKLAYPFLHADRIHTPTLFMGGDKDFNVPINGGEQMYLALRTLDVPTQLIVYPGQYHGLTRPSFVKDRMERLAAWYTQYVLPGKPPTH